MEKLNAGYKKCYYVGVEKIKFKIRRATKKDKDILVDFRQKLDVFEHSKSNLHFKQNRKEMEKYVLDCLSEPKYFFFVAVADGKPIGFSAATMWPHGRTKKLHGSLEAIWVEPEFRGQGIGRALTEVRIKKMKEYKPERIRTYTRPDNLVSQNNIKSFGAVHKSNVYEINLNKKKK